MNWKKRTQEEIQASVENKDYTGGYENFLSWVLYMRYKFFPWMVLMLFFGIYFPIDTVGETETIWLFIVPIACVSALVGVILYLYKRYKEMKKGISR